MADNMTRISPPIAVPHYIHRDEKVLIIEDNDDLRENLTELLIQKGLLPWSPTACSKACEQALLNPPDLIICDLVSPESKGFSFLRQMRVHRFLQQIPVLLLHVEQEMPVSLRDDLKAMDRIVTKPFLMTNSS